MLKKSTGMGPLALATKTTWVEDRQGMDQPERAITSQLLYGRNLVEVLQNWITTPKMYGNVTISWAAEKTYLSNQTYFQSTKAKERHGLSTLGRENESTEPVSQEGSKHCTTRKRGKGSSSCLRNYAAFLGFVMCVILVSFIGFVIFCAFFSHSKSIFIFMLVLNLSMDFHSFS